MMARATPNAIRVTCLASALCALAACEPAPTVAPQSEKARPLESAPDIIARQPDPAELLGGRDARLAEKVNEAIASEPGLRVQTIQVRARDGIVTLEGLVERPEDRQRAALVAQTVEGVRSVKNELRVPER